MKVFNIGKVKNISILIIASVLLVTVVCVCPFPIRVDTTMEGFYVDAQGQITENVSVEVTGWYLRYLLLEDDLRVEFDLNDPAKHSLKMQGATQLGDSEYFYASGWYYIPDENSVDGATMLFDKPFKRCALRFMDEGCYVLSSDPSVDLNAFWQAAKVRLSL